MNLPIILGVVCKSDRVVICTASSLVEVLAWVVSGSPVVLFSRTDRVGFLAVVCSDVVASENKPMSVNLNFRCFNGS